MRPAPRQSQKAGKPPSTRSSAPLCRLAKSGRHLGGRLARKASKRPFRFAAFGRAAGPRGRACRGTGLRGARSWRASLGDRPLAHPRHPGRSDRGRATRATARPPPIATSAARHGARLGTSTPTLAGCAGTGPLFPKFAGARKPARPANRQNRPSGQTPGARGAG